MHAREARELAELSANTNIKSMLEDIYKDIKTSALAGNKRAYWTPNCSSNVYYIILDILKNDGYTVCSVSQYNEITVTIEW